MDDRDIETIRPLFIGKTIVKMAMCSNAIYFMFNDGTDITIDTEYQGHNKYGLAVYHGNYCMFSESQL